MNVSSQLRQTGLAIAISCAGVVLAWLSGEPSVLLAAVAAVALATGFGAATLGVAICVCAFGAFLVGAGVHPPTEQHASERFAGFLIASLAVLLLMQRQRRFDALQLAKRAARLTVEHMPGLGWSTDAQGNFAYVNPGIVQYVGRPAEALNRMENADDFGWRKVIHPQDADEVLQLWLRSLRTGAPFEVEFRARRVDGIYRWFRNVGRPARDESGDIIGWYGTAIDIEDRKKAEEALRENERQFRSIIESIPAMVVGANADGEHEYSNQQLLDYVGLPVEEMVKDGWQRTLHPDDRDTVVREWVACMQGGIPVDRVHRLRRFDGVYRWIHARFNPIVDENGRIVRWYGILVDVDDQKRAEQVLRHNEQRLRLLIDTIPALVWSATPDGRRSYTSNRTLAYFGMANDDLDKPRFNMVHPDDSEMVMWMWADSLRTGNAFSSTHRLRRADGEYRWHEARAEALRDETGRIVEWYGVNVDVDDRQRAEDAVRNRELQLRLLIDTLPGLVWSVAPDGQPAYHSRRTLEYLGLRLEDVPNFREISVHPDDRLALNRAWERSIRTGQPFSSIHRLRRADGVYRWNESRADPLRDQNGVVLQWYGVNVDIDERMRAEQVLRATQAKFLRASQLASLAEMSASIAHEVNQPLTAVVSHSHACQRWLAASPPNIQRARGTIERIIRDANAAAEVVGRVRALFRQAVPTRVPVDLNEVIGEVRHMLFDEVAMRNVTVEADLDGAIPPIMADRVQLQQVLVNLVRNGVEAMMSSSELPKLLSIVSRREGPHAIRVEIRDQGTGLSDPEKIFEPFFTTKENGMGMGLAICRSIVEAHEGRLWAESNGSHGTVFTVVLPSSASDDS